MTPRPHIVRDATAHLSSELHAVLLRHMNVLEAGGASAIEGTATALGVLDRLAYEILGMFACQTRDPARAYAEVTAKLEQSLRDRTGELLRSIEQLSAAGVGHGRCAP